MSGVQIRLILVKNAVEFLKTVHPLTREVVVAAHILLVVGERVIVDFQLLELSVGHVGTFLNRRAFQLAVHQRAGKRAVNGIHIAEAVQQVVIDIVVGLAVEVETLREVGPVNLVRILGQFRIDAVHSLLPVHGEVGHLFHVTHSLRTGYGDNLLQALGIEGHIHSLTGRDH